MKHLSIFALPVAVLAAGCSDTVYDPRGVEKSETPPPVAPPAAHIPRLGSMEQSRATIMPEQTTSAVTVQVDFALQEQ